MANSKADRLLQKGIKKVKAAQQSNTPVAKEKLRSEARRLLLDVTSLDENNVQAWLWLSTVMDSLDEKRFCLGNALTLDPNNRSAQRGLAQLRQIEAAQAEPDIVEPADAAPTQATPAIRHSADGITECPFCGEGITTLDSACPHCQVPLVMACPACNTLMDIEQVQCSQCGHAMSDYRFGSVYFSAMAQDYLDHNRMQKAHEAILVAEQIDPNQPDLYRLKGEILEQQGYIGEAIMALRQAIENEPGQVGPHLNLGMLLQREGRWEEAEKVYKDILKRGPRSADIYSALGDLYLQRNRLKLAEKHLTKATHLNRNHGPSWLRLGQLYDAQGKRQAAIHAYRQANQLVSPSSRDGQLTTQRLKTIAPKMPAHLAQGWAEFFRQSTGPILVCLFAALLDSGLRPWWIPFSGWLALAFAVVGTVLWVSGHSLPQNPFIRIFTGRSSGLEQSGGRWLVAAVGVIFYLTAIAILLYPINQTFPQPPS